jgi:hypothetical protein
MSMMMLKRFRNELIILLAFIFALTAFFYKNSARDSVDMKKKEVETTITEINRVSELKKLWSSKKIAKEANGLKSIVAKKKIKLFKKTGAKVTVKYKELNVKELNEIVKKIMNRAFQISKLKIIETKKERYSMELICKW